MKWLVKFLVVLIVAVLFGVLAQTDPGYILIGRGTRTVEMSLSVFIILQVLLYTSIYFVVRFASHSWRMPERLRRWRLLQRQSRARRTTNMGLVHLAQGHWAQAEKQLLKNIPYLEMPLLNYLSAARAAHKQNAPERRDRYLALAHEAQEEAGFAVQLTQAELQLAYGQLEQSLASLLQLQTQAPRHSHVLSLLTAVYRRMKSWGDLKSLLPLLHKYHVMPVKELDAMEKEVHRALLQVAAEQRKPERLMGSWAQMPRDLRHDKDCIDDYARHLLVLGCHEEAEQLLREALKRKWNVNFAYLYGLTKASNATKQLSSAEQWLKNHERNPILLLTLGRLCLRCQLWGKARSYLEASLGAGPYSEAYRELGGLMERLEEEEKAREYFRKGLLLAADEHIYATLHIELDQRDVLRPLQSLENSKASEK